MGSARHDLLPTDLHHIFNLSGLVDLPQRFQISFSVSAYSRPPFSVYVSGIDFNGDGTQNDLLPGTRVNQFNRGLDKEDLARLVERYNEEFAGKLIASGQIAPRVRLPANYSFNDSYFTQNLRVSRTFSLGSEHVRLVLLAEAFNLLNTANLVQYREHCRYGRLRSAHGTPYAGVRLGWSAGVSVGCSSHVLRSSCSRVPSRFRRGVPNSAVFGQVAGSSCEPKTSSPRSQGKEYLYIRTQ
jgi:hypothetical protein